MVLALRPQRGGFLRAFGRGQLIFQFLSGKGPYNSPRIDPDIGACQGREYFRCQLGRFNDKFGTQSFVWQGV